MNLDVDSDIDFSITVGRKMPQRADRGYNLAKDERRPRSIIPRDRGALQWDALQ